MLKGPFGNFGFFADIINRNVIKTMGLKHGESRFKDPFSVLFRLDIPAGNMLLSHRLIPFSMNFTPGLSGWGIALIPSEISSTRPGPFGDQRALV